MNARWLGTEENGVSGDISPISADFQAFHDRG
jgi:hypothetical protein